MTFSRLRRFALVLLVSGTPASALAASAAPTDFKSLAYLAVNIISGVTALLVAIGVVVYLFGLVTSIYKSGEGGAKGSEMLRRLVGWGVLTFFVMFMIWAILRLLGNTLFGTDNFNSLGS